MDAQHKVRWLVPLRPLGCTAIPIQPRPLCNHDQHGILHPDVPDFPALIPDEGAPDYVWRSAPAPVDLARMAVLYDEF